MSGAVPNSQAIPIEEKVYWTYLIFIAFAIPEILTFMRCVRICMYKRFYLPSKWAFSIQFSAQVRQIHLTM